MRKEKDRIESLITQFDRIHPHWVSTVSLSINQVPAGSNDLYKHYELYENFQLN